MKRELSELEEVLKETGFMVLIGMVLILSLCFLRYHFIKKDQLLQTKWCDFNVITLSGVPYESVNDKFELTGNFVRAEDGDILLRGLDTSVMSVKRCLTQKGYDESILDRIVLSDTMPHVTP